MLFNSFEFILLFLPLSLLGFFALGRWSATAAAAWLGAASLFFYAWWDIRFLPLLLASIAFNFWVGLRICASKAPLRKLWLVFAIGLDLCLLAYFKYADFFLASANSITGANLPLLHVILPIGISFFTFTQIAYLVDAYKGLVREFRPLHYVLFVTYFPHLIAGPVLHHADMMPQFARRETYRIQWASIAFGMTLFIFGLAKKVLLADPLSPYVAAVFDSPLSPMLLEAWAATLAYTFQLYFDFSGYSDMALGLSCLFGVKLPINFNSPYKAPNIIEFWRRWHMTLSRFLRDYLYVALGGNRNGPVARYRNLMLTMLLGGLWHGAAWTFVFWGFLHGLYLALNHVWRMLKERYFRTLALDERGSYRMASHLLCFIAVAVAWVFFRAHSLSEAVELLAGMSGLNGLGLPNAISHGLSTLGLNVPEKGAGRLDNLQIIYLAMAALCCFLLPNSMEILGAINPGANPAGGRLALPRWRLSLPCALLSASLGLACLLRLTQAGEFLYFQF